ncbi:MAG: ABC transporter ATP-binding protein [Pseudomonadota bacterium]
MFERFFRYFESWIDPFGTTRDRLPGTLLAYILFFVRQAPITFGLALLMGGALGVIEITLFAYVGQVVDLLGSTTPKQVFQDYGPTFLWMAFFVMVIRLGVMTFGTVLDEQVIVPSFFNMVRWQNHNQVMRQSISFFEDDFAGRIATKVSQSGQSLGDFLITLLQLIWLFIIYVSGSLFLFGEINLFLALILVVWCVFYAALLVNFIPRVRRSARAFSEAQSVVNGRLVDAYSNMMLVKLDGASRREDAFIRTGMEDFVSAIRRYTRNITGMRFSLHVINGAMVVGVGYASILLWQAGAMTLGEMAFALGLVLRLTILATRMLGQFNGIFRAIGNIQNAMETTTKAVALIDAPNAYDMPSAKGAISFRDVHFRYEKNDRPEVIDGVSLDIAPGEKIGLVGPSGAGKSTLVRLLLRLHDIQAGSITLDGHNIGAITQDSLRRNIGMVMQETALLNRAVRDNIAYARADASDEQIFEAARKAKAHDFILGLQDAKGRSGYNAHVGERGVKLSGGQRQRLAIARVILKNAPILILDEATASLDSQVEAAIQESLDDLMADKTVIAIAHRLSTIAAMDRLIVLDGGRVVEVGTHRELVEKGGLYAQLWVRQTGGFLGVGALSGSLDAAQ